MSYSKSGLIEEFFFFKKKNSVSSHFYGRKEQVYLDRMFNTGKKIGIINLFDMWIIH